MSALIAAGETHMPKPPPPPPPPNPPLPPRHSEYEWCGHEPPAPPPGPSTPRPASGGVGGGTEGCAPRRLSVPSCSLSPGVLVGRRAAGTDGSRVEGCVSLLPPGAPAGGSGRRVGAPRRYAEFLVDGAR